MRTIKTITFMAPNSDAGLTYDELARAVQATKDSALPDSPIIATGLDGTQMRVRMLEIVTEDQDD